MSVCVCLRERESVCVTVCVFVSSQSVTLSISGRLAGWLAVFLCVRTSIFYRCTPSVTIHTPFLFSFSLLSHSSPFPSFPLSFRSLLRPLLLLFSPHLSSPILSLLSSLHHNSGFSCLNAATLQVSIRALEECATLQDIQGSDGSTDNIGTHVHLDFT